ncbi:hypothetical protein A5731_13020 [Mycolicibacterium conceptionense]|uniref:PPE domain-containing protein n=1 Tax=Mycolicibacterium conceptionense TaxID=451644 RepID=UPI0007EA8B1B|nr:PPE domain-containing protein [Mycolicibacterium conceptionense]OBB14669.1 hypothetical protein A5718_30270 [Mycolicibacterium conceptionense]OBF03409.1 hypothetical protein A5731_13020 [Mycolicibacterium conceptionense]
MGKSVDIDPDGVRGASAVLNAAPTAPSGVSVTPPAADATSVQVTTQLATLMGALDIDTTSSNIRTTDASTRLNTTAATYEEQENESSRSLAYSDTATSAAPVSVNMPTFAAPNVPSPPAVPAPAGVIPTTGHQIAQLIHGGPGADSLDQAATTLDNRATALDNAASTVQSARTDTSNSWSSTAADQADTHISSLRTSYTEQAERARSLASHARTQAANFRQAKAIIPTPEVFSNLERRLHAASVANSQPGSMGRYSATITDLQFKLAEANEKATRGFAEYTAAANTGPMGTLQPPGNQPGGRPGAPNATPGSTDAADLPGTDTDTADPLSADDPLSDPALDGATDTASEMMQTVLPAVLGGVSGALGGVLGAVSGAGQKLQEVGNQAVQGVTQGASALTSAMSAAAPELGGGDEPTGGAPDFGGFGGGGGGGMPGDTEPASSPAGPLTAPATTASTSAPIAAAPATVSAPAPTSPPMGGAPMGGGMMPPMMGAPMGGRGGGSEDDRRLYPERRLHIEEQPNTEPVKGRREARSVKQAEGDNK